MLIKAERKKLIVKMVFWVVIVMYTVFMIWLLIFAFSRTRGTTYKYNIIPFKTIYGLLINPGSKYIKWVIIRELFGNIVLFIPLGFFLSIYSKWEKSIFIKVALKTVIIMMIIESIQGITHYGMFDVDDVILNTIGSIAGCFLFVLIKKNPYINSCLKYLYRKC